MSASYLGSNGSQCLVRRVQSSRRAATLPAIVHSVRKDIISIYRLKGGTHLELLETFGESLTIEECVRIRTVQCVTECIGCTLCADNNEQQPKRELGDRYLARESKVAEECVHRFLILSGRCESLIDTQKVMQYTRY